MLFCCFFNWMKWELPIFFLQLFSQEMGDKKKLYLNKMVLRAHAHAMWEKRDRERERVKRKKELTSHFLLMQILLVWIGKEIEINSKFFGISIGIKRMTRRELTSFQWFDAHRFIATTQNEIFFLEHCYQFFWKADGNLYQLIVCTANCDL